MALRLRAGFGAGAALSGETGFPESTLRFLGMQHPSFQVDYLPS
jgi:hypothetical protein